MRFSLKQLAVFNAVADHGSVSKAANTLSLTQSATSMSLSQLEKSLGRPLFERQGKRMVLSHWGCWLRPKAKQLLHDARQIELGLYDQHLISGEIQLAASQTAAEHLVPELISKIDNDFPEIRIDLAVKNTEKVINGVLDYQFDLGIIEGRCDDSRICHEVWCDDHLVIIAAKHHPFARQKQISAAQLEQAKWILREPGAGTRRIFDGAIHGLVSDLDVWREYEHVAVLRTMVTKGYYLSCLPYLDVAAQIKSGELVALEVPGLNMARTLSFIWRADSSDNPVRECIRHEARQLIAKKPVTR
ncbi:DNA-binding transcriptional regulator, LysR family [Ferrimonas sediminum]|uniref:DNA-binding transcriptional regulator, LysR family n=1 Tax=Ferrimonas sediminum TaxID=718193 RepID=A0A1G8Y250_9GAMM|nr:LysR substrate-binding domain-containing protein [Ferrimonas sediminum]SDJ96757.1 DNA-binding transcriptional regulator, LysR family [Ferrimonas sediminum]